jgi:hypothetical protein
MSGVTPWVTRAHLCVSAQGQRLLVPVLMVEKYVFCLTGLYLTRRATIGRLANSPLAEGGSLTPPLRTMLKHHRVIT